MIAKNFLCLELRIFKTVSGEVIYSSYFSVDIHLGFCFTEQRIHLFEKLEFRSFCRKILHHEQHQYFLVDLHYFASRTAF